MFQTCSGKTSLGDLFVYTIGEISKIVKISTDTLRYYDEIGLLKPNYVESNSRYRYYCDEQIENILFITELKQYGFSLEEIKEILVCNDVLQLKKAFETKLNKLGIEFSKIKNTMGILQRRIKGLERENEESMNKSTILIVDDLFLVRILLKNIVEKFGYKVIGEAQNGVEACEKYFELKPDLVIMDITMPIMDGIYASMKIKEKDSNAKIIMCSGMSQATIVLESIIAGAYDYISKPFSEQRMLDAITKTIEGAMNYNNASLLLLANSLRFSQWKEVANNKPLTQKEVDTLLSLLNNNGAESQHINEFFNIISNTYEPTYTQEFLSTLRESNVDLQTLNTILSCFRDISGKATEIFSNDGEPDFTCSVYCVENASNNEIGNLLNKSSVMGTILYKKDSPPLTIFIPEVVNENTTIRMINFMFSELLPLLPKDAQLSIVSAGICNNVHITLYTQIYVAIQVKNNDSTNFIVGVGIPHEIVNSIDFKEKLMNWTFAKNV